MYKIMANGYFGTEQVATAYSEEDAKNLCKKFKDEEKNPYVSYSYRKEETMKKLTSVQIKNRVKK